MKITSINQHLEDGDKVTVYFSDGRSAAYVIDKIDRCTISLRPRWYVRLWRWIRGLIK
jgi:hypothetical protein